jgi:hypothetical protein
LVEPYSVFSVNVATNAVTTVVGRTPKNWYGAPAWSPDSSSLAYKIFYTDRFDHILGYGIGTVAATGRKPVSLTGQLGYDMTPLGWK